MLYWEQCRKAQETFGAWWRNELDFPVVQVQGPKEDAEKYAGLDMWGFLRHRDDPQRVIEQFERYCRNTFFGGEAFPNLWINLGPGVLAAYFTGHLEFSERSETAWFEKPTPWERIGELEFDERGPWWRYTLEIAECAAQAGKDRFIVGMTDMGGNLDVLAALRGSQNLCLDLIHEPDKVSRAVSKIDDAWEKAYSALDAVIARTQRGTAAWMGIWCPKRWYPLQCDFSAMISPQMFEQFVAPSLRRLCRFLDFTIYHLDGPGQLPHLDVLLDIPELDGIQWVPGAGNPQNEAPQWFPLYERILSKNKRLVLQCWDDPRSIPAVLERIPHKGLLVSATFPTEAEAGEVLHTVRGQCNGLS